MDQMLNFLTHEELVVFFRRKKTEISCIEEPNIFLNQLRDHDLVPEDLYKKVIKRKNKKRIRDGVYEILDWVENEGGDNVKKFWRCVLENHIQQNYPVFRILKNSIQDGSYRKFVKGSEKERKEQVQKEGATKRKRGNEETTEEEPGPSSGSSQKKPAKEPTFSSLPVTCGEKTGRLYPDKLAKGEECILSQDQWFNPVQFERFSGKERSKNWKVSIRSENTPLQKLIKEGQLKCPRIYRNYSQKKRTVSFNPVVETYSSSSVSSEEDDDSDDDLEEGLAKDEQDDEEEDDDDDHEPADLSKLQTLPVSCGFVNGILYKNRFTGGTRSKSIRTEERWFTPEDFVKQEITDGHWKKDILCYRKPLYYLIEILDNFKHWSIFLQKSILQNHYLWCQCCLCRPEEKEQDNDDVCYICNSERNLVCCDECPRAFHHHCHLPDLQDNALGDSWICTYCVFKHNLKLWIHMNRRGALSSPVAANLMRCEYLLLFLFRADSQRVLTDDPTKNGDRYAKVISKPMWLKKVKTKLQENKYRTVGQFVRDIRLILNNCQTFHRDNNYGRMGAKLKKQFEKEFKSVFKIQ